MNDNDILILGSSEISALLEGGELQILDVIREAYVNHRTGASSLPHSTFLRFPDNPANRIIALPAYLGGGVNSAGVKWIASFPANLERGMDRASAVLILNSAVTGRPKAIMEASIISAKRTAASAALAAQVLDRGLRRSAGFIGCGPINFEIARFLHTACPELCTFVAFDLQSERASAFKDQCEEKLWLADVQTTNSIDDVFGQASLISFATTAGTPHVHRLDCVPGAVILHISLRDLSPEVILSADNVVDDVDHVCRAHTSIHLTEQRTGHREFIRCTLADILNGTEPSRPDRKSPTIFSPFGLGVLDIALAEFVFQQAVQQSKGLVVRSFLPQSWPQTTCAISA